MLNSIEVVEVASIIDENNHLRTKMLNCLSYRSGCPSELTKKNLCLYIQVPQRYCVACVLGS